MPIDIERFNDADDEELTAPTNGEQVVRFLLRNDDQAFRPAEIAENTGVKKTSISTVLRRLENRNLVRHKGDYWAIGDEDLVRDAFEFHRTLAALDDRHGEENLKEWRSHADDDPDPGPDR